MIANQKQQSAAVITTTGRVNAIFVFLHSATNADSAIYVPNHRSVTLLGSLALDGYTHTFSATASRLLNVIGVCFKTA